MPFFEISFEKKDGGYIIYINNGGGRKDFKNLQGFVSYWRALKKLNDDYFAEKKFPVLPLNIPEDLHKELQKYKSKENSPPDDLGMSP